MKDNSDPGIQKAVPYTPESPSDIPWKSSVRIKKHLGPGLTVGSTGRVRMTSRKGDAKGWVLLENDKGKDTRFTWNKVEGALEVFLLPKPPEPDFSSKPKPRYGNSRILTAGLMSMALAMGAGAAGYGSTLRNPRAPGKP